jgi:hypothetical protein
VRVCKGLDGKGGCPIAASARDLDEIRPFEQDLANL